MAKFRKNESAAIFRNATVFIYLSDGVTPAPLATTITTGVGGNVQVRQGGTTYVDAAGTMTNCGVDGQWVYQATQAETNFDGTEFDIKVVKTTFFSQIWTVEMVRSIWDEIPGSLLAGSYGEMTARPGAAVVADAGNTTLTFLTTLTASGADTYKDTWCVFLTGALIGQTHKVSAYNGNTKALTFTTPFSATPSNTDRFMIINK